jgi:hypothetical protein
LSAPTPATRGKSSCTLTPGTIIHSEPCVSEKK